MSSAILLSGGIDSIAIAYWKKPEYAITIDYGQKCAKSELEVSSLICSELEIKHEILSIDCRSIGYGLMSTDLKTESLLDFSVGPEWWPYRNQLIITLGAAKSILLGADQLLIGTVSSDSKHLDGTEVFIKKINELLLYQEGNLKLIAPGLKLNSLELVKKSRIPSEYIAWAFSCHTGNIACGECPGCHKNLETMKKIIPEVAQ